MTGGPWPIERHRGSAIELHALELPEPMARALWWLDVDGPALALGSTQRLDALDEAAAAEVAVVRRRSGGGAVLLDPGEVTWVDVLLPAADDHWVDDVGRSAIWLGRCWVEALGALGVDAQVHEGPMMRDEWSRWACFGGLAPGEVLVDGRKVLGIAQRRTRAGARLQCALLHRWRPDRLVAMLAIAPSRRAEAIASLAANAAGIGGSSGPEVVDALAAALRSADA